MFTFSYNVLMQMDIWKRRSLPIRIKDRYSRRIQPRKVSHLVSPRNTNIGKLEMQIFGDAAIEIFVCEAREFFFEGTCLFV